MQQRMLDPRLSLAFDLYDPCDLAADIGTDHAHLPAALLQRGRCRHMILTDISKSALENARMEMIRQAITRAIADQARTIRIPVHMVETINKLIRVSRQLLQQYGREPTPEEIAA